MRFAAFRLHPVRAHLFPLAVGAIVVATAIPIALRAPVIGFGAFSLADFLANLLLFAPFGIALRHRPLWFVIIMAAFLSSAVEISQIWSVDRFTSVFDVAANSLGALAAAYLSRRWVFGGWIVDSDVCFGPWAMVGLLSLVVVLVSVWRLPHPSSALDDWDSSYPLLLGNELTGDRVWRGEIKLLGLWAEALSPGNVADASAEAFRAHGAIYATPKPLKFPGGPAVRLPDDVAKAFVAGVARTNAFTIAARFKPNNIEQKGPARILSFSVDPYRRNVDLGQEERKLSLRIRTDVSGANGNDHKVLSVPILQAKMETEVLATYDGAVAKVFVDGILVGRTNLAAKGCTWSALCDRSVPGIWAGLAAIATLLAVSVFGSGSRRVVWLCAILSVGVVTALGLLHPDPALRPWREWPVAFMLIGAAIAALSIRPLSGARASGENRASRS